MDERVTVDFSKTGGFIQEHELKELSPFAQKATDMLLKRTGAGANFAGWVDLPENYDRDEFARIQKAADRIRKDSDALVVIGIGGSYLGARAAIEFLGHSFANVVTKAIRKSPEIYFCGNNLSAKYIKDLEDVVCRKKFSINVVSKSGTTTEPAIAFRIFKKILEKKYGRKHAARRIYVTTDREKGALRKLSAGEGYETFSVPDDIGGRYSVLTAVGLLPIAVGGWDIKQLMKGAATMREALIREDFVKNDAMKYACVRNILFRKGKGIEVLANYEPSLHYLCEWWKQLFGESEGKDQKGIFPASMDFTTDLHSLGQFIQDGSKILFETVLTVQKPSEEIVIREDSSDADGLNYLAGKTIDFVNKSAMEGAILAHTDGSVPNLIVRIPQQNEYFLGQLFYFFEFSCAISGYLLDVNPFDQPGVESYKTNMFALLGKPGY